MRGGYFDLGLAWRIRPRRGWFASRVLPIAVLLAGVLHPAVRPIAGQDPVGSPRPTIIRSIQNAERIAANSQLAGSEYVRCDLVTGGRIIGRIVSGPLEMEISFGRLQIPFEHLLQVAPGLKSRPELVERITAQIDQLGAPSLLERNRAEESLREFGPKVIRVLEQYDSDGNEERLSRIERLLAQMRASGEKIQPWIDDDKIQMVDYQFQGRITSPTISLRTAFGDLSVPISEIESITPTPSTDPVDLLSLIQPEKDTVAGEWRSEGPTLVSPIQEYARLQIPYVPSGEYQLRLSFFATNGVARENAAAPDALVVLAPIDGAKAAIFLNAFDDKQGDFISGLMSVVMDKPVVTPIKKGPVFDLAKPAEVVVTVRGRSIEVEMNREHLFSWRGDRAEFALTDHTPWGTSRRDLLGIGAYLTEYRFTQIELVALAPSPSGGVPKLAPGDWLMWFADSSMLAAKPDPDQILQLPDGRAMGLEQVATYQRQDDGTYRVQLASGEAVLLDAPLAGSVRMATPFGKIFAPLDKLNALEPGTPAPGG